MGWEELVEKKFTPEKAISSAPLTIIIPVYNSSENLAVSLESIKKQRYSPLEIIVVDAMSTDHTMEIARSYYPFVKRIYTVTKYNLFDMVNRAIHLATGTYVSILMPGSFYLSERTYDQFANVAEQKNNPSLIYFGSIQHEMARAPRQIFEPFERAVEEGRDPATLSACFFHADLFEKIGTFKDFLTQRGLLDLFFRIKQNKELRVESIERFYIDFERKYYNFANIPSFAKQTFSILSINLGFWKALSWFLGHFHFMRLAKKKIKKSLRS